MARSFFPTPRPSEQWAGTSCARTTKREISSKEKLSARLKAATWLMSLASRDFCRAASQRSGTWMIKRS